MTDMPAGDDDARGDDEALRVAEAALFALLARLFAAELDAATVEVLATEPFLALVREACPEAATDLTRTWTDEDLENAAVEYCRLFVQPGGTPPLAAAWLEHDPGGAANPVDVMVKRLIEAARYELPPSLSVLPRDHIAVLACIASDLREHGEPLLDEFMRGAFAPWVRTFAEALETKTAAPVYRLAARWLVSLTGASPCESDS